jgi:hypothetical protein
VTLRLPFALADTSIAGDRAVRIAWIAPEASLSIWFDLLTTNDGYGVASR